MFAQKAYSHKVDSNGDVRTVVTGLSYQCPEDWEDILGSLNSHSNITLQKEPDNPHDKFAIAAYLDDRKIGYVSKDDINAITMFMGNEPVKCDVIEKFQSSFEVSFEHPNKIYDDFTPEQIFELQPNCEHDGYNKDLPHFEIYALKANDETYDWYDDRIVIPNMERWIVDFNRKFVAHKIELVCRQASDGRYYYYLPYLNWDIAEVSSQEICKRLETARIGVALPDVATLTYQDTIVVDLKVGIHNEDSKWKDIPFFFLEKRNKDFNFTYWAPVEIKGTITEEVFSDFINKEIGCSVNHAPDSTWDYDYTDFQDNGRGLYEIYLFKKKTVGNSKCREVTLRVVRGVSDNFSFECELSKDEIFDFVYRYKKLFFPDYTLAKCKEEYGKEETFINVDDVTPHLNIYVSALSSTREFTFYTKYCNKDYMDMMRAEGKVFSLSKNEPSVEDNEPTLETEEPDDEENISVEGVYAQKVLQYPVDFYGDVRTLVRGLPYQCPDDWEEVLDSLDEDSNLYLIKEPDNPKDKFAIAAYLDDRRIGYVAASDNTKVWLFMTDEKMPCTFLERFEASFKISFENPRSEFEGMSFEDIYMRTSGLASFEIPFLTNPKDDNYDWYDDSMYIIDMEKVIPDFRRKLAARMIVFAGRSNSNGEYCYYLPYSNNPVADVDNETIKSLIDKHGFVITLPDVPMITKTGSIFMDLHVTYLTGTSFRAFNNKHDSEIVFRLSKDAVKGEKTVDAKPLSMSEEEFAQFINENFGCDVLNTPNFTWKYDTTDFLGNGRKMYETYIFKKRVSGNPKCKEILANVVKGESVNFCMDYRGSKKDLFEIVYKYKKMFFPDYTMDECKKEYGQEKSSIFINDVNPNLSVSLPFMSSPGSLIFYTLFCNKDYVVKQKANGTILTLK